MRLISAEICCIRSFQAADNAASDLALESLRSALKADAIVAVQQERAAHVSRAAQVSQATAYNSAALSAKLTQLTHVMRTLEAKAISLASSAKVLTTFKLILCKMYSNF